MRNEVLSTKMLSTPSFCSLQRYRKTGGQEMGINLKNSIHYLINEEKDRSFGLLVNAVGQQQILPDTTYPLKEHPADYFFNVKQGRVLDEYQLIYIIDGSGEFYSKKNEWRGEKIKAGHLMWITPGQWHSYRPNLKTGWTEYYIGFKGEVIENMTRHSFLHNKNATFYIGFNEELAGLFMRALDIARTRKDEYQPYLAGIVMHMMGLIISQLNELMERTSCMNDQKIEQAKIIMKQNVSADLDLKQLASTLNMSYSWFRKLFKGKTGQGPARYFLELKIEKVKQLLISTDMPVKELLYILGYNTTENFYSAFKKYTGFTPIEYRRMMIEEKAAG